MSHNAAYEAALAWKTSSFCGASSANCLAAAVHEDDVFVRDTKGPDARMLGFSLERWSTFMDELRG